MKRRPVQDGARFLTFSCYKRLQLLGNAHIRDAAAHLFEEAHERFGFVIIAWVFMPEHIHLMLRPTPGESDIVEPLAWFKRETGRQVIGRWRLLKARVLPSITDEEGRPHFWQHGGGYDRNIWSAKEIGGEGRLHPPQPGEARSCRALGGLGVVQRSLVQRAARLDRQGGQDRLVTSAPPRRE
jgi:REP element-mobilizing transposase RayT